MTVVEKRRCGPCTVCCVTLKIEAPELRKKAQTPCRHLTASGCGIYETRPGVCQQFLCGWRLFPELDDKWRPDLSGVLVMRQAPEQLPPAWSTAAFGVELAVTGGENVIHRPGFAEYVARLLAKGVPVSLSAASPSTLINEHLDAAAAARDIPGLRHKLLGLYALLHAARWEKGTLGMLVPLYRLKLDRQRFLAQKSLYKSRQ
jgi:hypothetical protein